MKIIIITEVIPPSFLPSLFKRAEPLPEELKELVNLSPARGGIGIPNLKVIPYCCTAHPVLRITQCRPRSYSGFKVKFHSSVLFPLCHKVSREISKQNNV